eukprot:915932-Pelagomonas_calceolata.AAC.4
MGREQESKHCMHEARSCTSGTAAGPGLRSLSFFLFSCFHAPLATPQQVPHFRAPSAPCCKIAAQHAHRFCICFVLFCFCCHHDLTCAAAVATIVVPPPAIAAALATVVLPPALDADLATLVLPPAIAAAVATIIALPPAITAAAAAAVLATVVLPPAITAALVAVGADAGASTALLHAVFLTLACRSPSQSAETLKLLNSTPNASISTQLHNGHEKLFQM